MKSLKILFVFSMFVMALNNVLAQKKTTGINNQNPSTKVALDIRSTPGYSQGFFMPRLATSDTSLIGVTLGKDRGLMFYDSSLTGGFVRWWDGAKWKGGNSSDGSYWQTNGNALISADTLVNFKYIGTNSPFPLIFATDGQQRMRISRNGNIGIGMNPTGGIPLSLKSNGLGQVFSIERSKGDNLFEFREDANLNAKLQMYDVDGSPTVEFNADPKLFSHLFTSGFGIGNADPKVVLDVSGDFATRPTSIDLSAADSYAALSTKGVSIFYVLGTSPAGAKIHGMADGVPGKHLYFTNRASSPVIFIDNSGDASVAVTDVIITGGLDDYQILNGQTAHFIYNGGRWRLVSAPSTAGALSGIGANNKLAFWNGSSNLTYNTNLHWNNIDSRLGIGTTATSDPLTVQAGTQRGIGLVGSANQSLRMYYDATNNMIFESSNPIKFYPNGGGEALHIDDGDIITNVPLTVNGYARANSIGVGMVPVLPLHVQIPLAQELPTTGAVAIGHMRLDAADSPIVLTMGVADDGAYNGAWFQAHYKTAWGTTRPILLNPNGGNVGIGTTNPLSTLHVDGPIATAMTNRTAANQTILATESVVVKGANGACTYTLPPVVDGKVITIVNNGAVGSGNITIASPTIIAGVTTVTPKSFNICVGFGVTWMCK